MSNKKIQLIKANTEEELVEKINNLKIDFFATQPMQKTDSTWVCFIYYEPKLEGEKPSQESQKHPKIKDPDSPATPKQIKLLKNLKYLGDTSKLTKLEASQLIDEGLSGKKKKEDLPDY